METHLKIIGILQIVLACCHLFFPRYFNWKAEFSSLSIINREMMYIHSFFIGLTVFLMGIASLFYSDSLIHTEFGNIIALGFGIFWSARLFAQFFGYSSKNWRGKRFETTIHILFSFLWAYFSLVYIAGYLY